jgi:hypothetical protein
MEAKETDAIDYLKGFLEGKKAGIKEVVDWISPYLFDTVDGKYLIAQIGQGQWEAKLKEWGI